MSFRFASLLSLSLLVAAGGAVAQTAPAQTAPATGDDPVVAKINDRVLHRSDVMAAQHNLPPQVQKMPLEAIYPQLLDQMVSSVLITEAGKKENLADDPEVKSRMARYQDRVIQEVYLSHAIESATTDDKLKEHFPEYLKNHPPKEEVSARHILVQKEEEAKEIIAELGKGADFAELAKQRSTDPGRANGGDLGYFTREDMVPEFSDAAFKLNKGEYTKEPVKTQFGWHVIKVEDKRTAPPPSFEEAKEELSNEVAREVVMQKIAELRQGAKVETFGLDGKPMAAKN